MGRRDWHPAEGYYPAPDDLLATDEPPPPAPARSDSPPLHRDPCLLFALLPALAWLALRLAGR